jgi:hypothetical protein
MIITYPAFLPAILISYELFSLIAGFIPEELLFKLFLQEYLRGYLQDKVN